MANYMPPTMTVTVRNDELANELEAIALAYEEAANKIRFQAQHLRNGFELSLAITAEQVRITPTPEPNDMDAVKDIAGRLNIHPSHNHAFGEPIKNGYCPGCVTPVTVNIEPNPGGTMNIGANESIRTLPEEAIELINQMTGHPIEEEEE